MKKKFDEIVEKLKESKSDPEIAHGLYDDAMRVLAENAHADLVKKLDKLVKNIPFWYA